MTKQEYLIALGSNLGSGSLNPAETLASALKALQHKGLQLLRVSRFFETPCFPAGAGPDYVNAAAAIRSEQPPAEVLAALHRIEAEHDRQRISRWAARTLDLDMLAQEETVLPDREHHDHWRDLPPEAQQSDTPQTLILPHPRIQDRGFVLVPLCDVAPHWRHPTLGLTALQLRDALPAEARDEVIPL
jgi:2-amino-4-hydroxy-6-hydroxymethyldihydropteridine diphosphokinase